MVGTDTHLAGLRCPSCDESLTSRDGAVQCTACATTVSVRDGILRFPVTVDHPSTPEVFDLLSPLYETAL